jgi:hypothetical protein
MRITLERSVLEKLLHRAAFAAHLVGHLDDNAHRALVDQLGEHVDAVVHCLTEILGDPCALAEEGAAGLGDRKAYNGTPMLPASAGGAR